MGWAKRMIDAGQSPNMFGEMPSFYNMLKWGNESDHNLGLPKIWNSNVKTNHEYLCSLNGKVTSAREIQKHTGKAAILVGASPILNNTYEHLQTIDRDKFIIIATNSSAKFLVDHNIAPDYIFLIDGQKGKWTLDIGEEKLASTLIVSPFAEPEALKNWKGKLMVIPFDIKDEVTGPLVREKWGDPIGQAGNSLNCAVAFFAQCTDIRIYLFMGNELSFKTRYYNDRPSLNDDTMYFFATNVKGEKVKTYIPLYQYKIWPDSFMDEMSRSGYFFFNCSEGILGVDVDNSLMPCVTQMPIDKAIKQVLNAFEFEQQDEMTKSKRIYDLLYENEIYCPRNGIAHWRVICEAIEKGEIERPAKMLDVGCALGASVYDMKEKGYDICGIDIADNTRAWKEFGIENKCFVAPAHNMPFSDNTFDFVYCGDVMEHIAPEFIQPTLKEILRVGSQRFWFLICETTDVPVGEKVHTHATTMPMEWWVGQVGEAGFAIVEYGHHQYHTSIYCVKEDICQKQ